MVEHIDITPLKQPFNAVKHTVDMLRAVVPGVFEHTGKARVYNGGWSARLADHYVPYTHIYLLYPSVWTNSPERSLGSNHVDFGGII
jgi:hypothetical protein